MQRAAQPAAMALRIVDSETCRTSAASRIVTNLRNCVIEHLLVSDPTPDPPSPSGYPHAKRLPQAAFKSRSNEQSRP